MQLVPDAHLDAVLRRDPSDPAVKGTTKAGKPLPQRSSSFIGVNLDKGVKSRPWRAQIKKNSSQWTGEGGA